MKWAVVLTLLVCFGACGEQEPDVSSEPFEWPEHLGPLRPLPPPYVLGSGAPEFGLPIAGSQEQDSIRLADFRGKVVVLNFWNTGCVPCVAEHQTINRVAERYAPRGVHYLGINFGDTPERFAAFEAEHGRFIYPNLEDWKDEVGVAYKRPGWPLHVVIDRGGRVAWWRSGGPIKEEALITVIEDVLAGRRPTAPTPAAYPEEERS